MSSYDLVIRGGTVIDGTGAPGFVADVAVQGGRIAAVGQGIAPGVEEIDATGMIVTPGFVDIHTHYDGQVTWDNRLLPSSCHGVTTAVIGNCGVGFAPCRPENREGLVRLMEGVEDIPYPVLTEGLSWNWTTFGDYLDLLAAKPFDMDLAAYLPHAALRVYVMGQRGADREPATEADIAEMCRLLGEALDAGALGIATSRTIFHRSSDGKSVPTLDASDAELIALAGVLREKGKGVFQIVEDLHLPTASLKSMRAIAEAAGRPLTFSIGAGNSGQMVWPKLLEELGAANAAGVVMKGQLMPRAIGMILGVELTLNPFYTTASYQAIAHLPLAERLAEMRKPEVRAAILAEPVDPDPALVLGRMVREWDTMFLLVTPDGNGEPDYEQPPERSIAAMAKARGISPEELAYEVLVAGEAGGKLYLAMANYTDGSLDAVGQILEHPDVVLGLGDGGAHCGTICDASYSTFALQHWGRDRERGRKSIPDLVHRMTGATADVIGLKDRGRIAPGLRADLNVIDLANLTLHEPEVHYDLPAGGRRLIQKATGYRATLVNGQVVSRNDEPTGALPGKLVRA